MVYVRVVDNPVDTPKRRRRRTVERPSDLAVAYLRVSTEEQVKSGAGLGGQRAAIESYAAARGWTIIEWYADDGVSGTVSPDDRGQLSAALHALAEGRAGILLFHRPDRLARKAADLLALRDRAEREGWLIASSDGQVDLTSAGGRLMFTVLGGVAEMERDLISQRTREALAARRAAGVRLGRPSALPREVLKRILSERADGRTWRAIADGLNEDGVPTAQGGQRWWASSVSRAASGQDAANVSGGS
jgi:DNA invertase Pin-like site-specific DNA recombinase